MDKSINKTNYNFQDLKSTSKICHQVIRIFIILNISFCNFKILMILNKLYIIKKQPEGCFKTINLITKVFHINSFLV